MTPLRLIARPLLVFLAAFAPTWAAPLDRAAMRDRFGHTGDEVWRSALEPEKHNPRVSTFFNHALTLCETGLHPERLEKLFALAASRQDLDPKSETYGSFRWRWNDSQVTDRNSIEFCMHPAAFIWKKTPRRPAAGHPRKTPPAPRSRREVQPDPQGGSRLHQHRPDERRQPDRARRRPGAPGDRR